MPTERKREEKEEKEEKEQKEQKEKEKKKKKKRKMRKQFNALLYRVDNAAERSQTQRFLNFFFPHQNHICRKPHHCSLVR